MNRKLPVKRFRCKSCDKTFGYLPWFVLRLIRWVAPLVQRCWERWTNEETLEDVAGTEDVPGRSVQRWCSAVWKRRKALNRTLRRLLRAELPEPPPVDTPDHRSWSQYLLPLIRQYLQQATPPREDNARPPYHYIYALR